MIVNQYCLELGVFLNSLTEKNKTWFVVTNDASKDAKTAEEKYLRKGLKLAADKIISSGSLVKDYIIEHNLHGAKALVLGPSTACNWVESMGVSVINHSFQADDPFDLLIVSDDGGFPFLETVNKVISSLYKKIKNAEKIHLLAPNPDLLYPAGKDSYNLAAGSIVSFIENALKLRFPNNKVGFTFLGKPYRPIFEKALKLAGQGKPVMIGDQMMTDILGAKSVNIDSVLMASGVSDPSQVVSNSQMIPTYYMNSLSF